MAGILGRAVVAGIVVAGVTSAVGAARHADIAAARAATAPTTTATTAATGPGSYVALPPSRILDTRSGVGGPTGALSARNTLSFTVTGTGGVPAAADVSAVVFNLTVTDSAAGGYVSAYPAGQARPPTSSVNFAAGETRAHLVVVAPGAGGQVSLFNGTSSALDLVADVTGYYTAGAPDAGGEFGTLTPARVLDTRTGLGVANGQIKPDSGAITFRLEGVGGVPSAGVSAVMLNLTATRPHAAGYLSVANPSRDQSSTLNFQAGETASNLVLASVDGSGSTTIAAVFHDNASSTVDVVADVMGYVAAGAPAAPGRTGPMPGRRLLDTRDTGVPGPHPIPAHGVITLTVAGTTGIPSSGVTAAVLNFTVVSPAAAGYLTAYPSGATRPVASTVNFASHTLANQVLVSLGSDGSISIYNGSNAGIDVVVDASGFIGPIPGPLTWSGRATLATDSDDSIDSIVSCPSPSFCMVATDLHIFQYDGTSWSKPQPSPVVAGNHLTGLSCGSSTLCVAFDDEFVYVYQGGTWTHTTLGSGNVYVQSVSCISATFCMIGGLQDNISAAWIYNGTTWNLATSGLSPGGSMNVSCTSVTFCLGIGGYSFASTFNGSTWTSAAFSSGSQSLSCVSTTFCMDITPYDQFRVFNGTTWSAAASAPSSLPVSCSSPTFCAMTDTEASFFDGTAWTSEVALDPYLPLDDVSCPTTSFCVAVDGDGAIVGR